MAHSLTSRAGFTAAVLGAMLLAELGITSMLFTADQDFVYFLGHRINYVCAARQRYGIPCPTCGLTRGFVLTVHGKAGDAWRLSPTGPLAAGGMFGMGAMLLIYAALERRGRQQLSWMPRLVRAGALTYASVGTLIWMGSWVSTVIKLRGHP
ncbi:MAG TPA: DUF2752 domain-containing protein [Bryobacteraceae bacterium]|nr:DUF2752 domain-containing protein [Bryobacteraceae bacterium]